jgi:hypothetical protein
LRQQAVPCTLFCHISAVLSICAVTLERLVKSHQAMPDREKVWSKEGPESAQAHCLPEFIPNDRLKGLSYFAARDGSLRVATLPKSQSEEDM